MFNLTNGNKYDCAICFIFFLLRGAELVDEHVRTQLDAVRLEDKGKMDRIRKS